MGVFKAGPLVAEVRGKIGELVFTRGQGGAAIRTIGTWLQPDTPAQLESRATLEALSQAWSGTLSHPQRNTWRAYALFNPRPNRWGGLTLTNGYLAFIRHNAHSYRDAHAIQFLTAPPAGPLHPPALQLQVQQNGAIVVAGVLDPDVTGLYKCGGTWLNHPYFKHETLAWFIFWSTPPPGWRLSQVLGDPTPPRWASVGLIGTAWSPTAPATGTGTTTWSYAASLAKITTPPANYATPADDLTLYLYTGRPILSGRTYYKGPWAYMTTLQPPIPHGPAVGWYRWTWPQHAVGDPYVWTPDGTDSARAYVIAQDAATGSISTPHVITPAFGSLSPW